MSTASVGSTDSTVTADLGLENSAYRPDTAVFVYQRGGESRGVTECGIDYIAGRWRTELDWANDKKLGYHRIGRTVGWLLECRYVRALKTRYLRHAAGDVTDGYGVCRMEELTRAMTDLLDFEHPLLHGLEERGQETMRRPGLVE